MSIFPFGFKYDTFPFDRKFFISEIYRRLLLESGSINIPLYYHSTDTDGTTRNECHPPINDDFYALAFWFDLLGHRLIEALPVEHRLSYRDELFLRVDLESHELVYAYDKLHYSSFLLVYENSGLDDFL